jgi:hypothetical protein
MKLLDIKQKLGLCQVCGKASSNENGDEGGEGRVSEIPELSFQSILNAISSHLLFGKFH